MRGARRPGPEAEEGGEAFVSMTDMTVSFLFIVMILLAFFATQLRSKDTVPMAEYDEVRRDRDDLRDRLNAALAQIAALDAAVEAQTDRAIRAEIEVAGLRQTRDALQAALGEATGRVAELEAQVLALTTRAERAERDVADLTAEVARLRQELAAQRRGAYERYVAEAQERRAALLAQLKAVFPEDWVEISPENDALRFVGENLFSSGARTPTAQGRGYLAQLAQRLDTLLPCYTLPPRPGCGTENPGFALVETVLIEGHTDGVGGEQYNVQLSTDRSVNTFALMRGAAPGVMGHLNWRGQPVLALAGYGPFRPADPGPSLDNPRNRRIDLRIIMYAPANLEELDSIKANMREAFRGWRR